MLVWPASRAMLAAVLRNAAMSCGAGAEPDPRGVFTLGHVADVVDAVLDRPVALEPVGEQGRVGGAVVQGGDRVDDLYRGLAGTDPAPADDLDRPAGVRERAWAGVPPRSMTLIERDSVRPWPRPRRRQPGAGAQGRRIRACRRWGWLPLTVNR